MNKYYLWCLSRSGCVPALLLLSFSFSAELQSIAHPWEGLWDGLNHLWDRVLATSLTAQLIDSWEDRPLPNIQQHVCANWAFLRGWCTKCRSYISEELALYFEDNQRKWWHYLKPCLHYWVHLVYSYSIFFSAKRGLCKDSRQYINSFTTDHLLFLLIILFTASGHLFSL